METEFNLSEKRVCSSCGQSKKDCAAWDEYNMNYDERDVKKFIRLLKELKGIKKHKTILKELDKLAGEDLVI